MKSECEVCGNIVNKRKLVLFRPSDTGELAVKAYRMCPTCHRRYITNCISMIEAMRPCVHDSM